MGLPDCTKLQQIDNQSREDHKYLIDEDVCFYIGEYTSGCGYKFSTFNDLISNLKKPPSRRGKPEYRYKLEAINWVASCFRKNLREDALEEWLTLVPIPPSKARGHPDYDDRMMEICRRLTHGLKSPDVSELIAMRQDIEPFHAHGGHRMPPDELMLQMRLEVNKGYRPRSAILLVDDVLTTGSHFKACQRLLEERFPDSKVWGLFVARRVFPDPCP